MLNLATQILGLTGTFTLKDALGEETEATATILHSSHPDFEKAFLNFGEALRNIQPEGDAEAEALSNEELAAKRKTAQAVFLTAITKSINGVTSPSGKEIGEDKAAMREVFETTGLEWFNEQFFVAQRDNRTFLPVKSTPKKTKKG